MTEKQKRWILHLDMDAFFAAVEQRDYPSYQGKPVVIGANPEGGKGRGVVSTASYEARRYGIRSAMPISQAYRLCPRAIFLPVDFEKYHRVSREIFDLLYEFSPHIEQISIDEAFLDITETFHLFGTPFDTGLLLKVKIREKTGLTVSIGLGANKRIAKIASETSKPDGLLVVEHSQTRDFLWPLGVEKIAGLGKKTLPLLHKAGICTIGQLAQTPLSKLTALLGRNQAMYFFEVANGEGNDIVVSSDEVKSISVEETFPRDVKREVVLSGALMEFCERISFKLDKDQLRVKTITLKLRYSDFKTISRSKTVGIPVHLTHDLFKIAVNLFSAIRIQGRGIRLLGLRVSGFMPASASRDLFSPALDQKWEEVADLTVKILRRYGQDALHRGRQLQRHDVPKSRHS